MELIKKCHAMSVQINWVEIRRHVDVYDKHIRDVDGEQHVPLARNLKAGSSEICNVRIFLWLERPSPATKIEQASFGASSATCEA